MVKSPIFACSLLSAALSFTLCAQSLENNFTKANYGQLFQEVSESLVKGFVIPEVAPKYKMALEQCIKEDCLANVSDEKSASKAITNMLQAVYPDKHLKVFAPGEKQKRKKRKSNHESGNGHQQQNTSGLISAKVLADNIGYLKLGSFPGTPESIAAIHDAMKAMKDTNAIVFDIQNHRGGSPEDINEITSFLFSEPTHMVTTFSPHMNDGKRTKKISTPNEFATFYKDKPVYLLVSEETYSAGEHFAMSMKATGRGILIGNTTAGYGHWGGIAQLTDGYSLFLPMGGTFHPVNGLGWEGIGITPDIEVSKEESLAFTLDRIRALM
ncbi:S41 family peptidase [Thalassotalea ganghwensis]